MSDFLKIGLVLALIALVILGPWTVVWSLNTLFPALNIPYTFWTWLAVLVLGGAVKSKMNVSK